MAIGFDSVVPWSIEKLYLPAIGYLRVNMIVDISPKLDDDKLFIKGGIPVF